MFHFYTRPALKALSLACSCMQDLCNGIRQGPKNSIVDPGMLHLLPRCHHFQDLNMIYFTVRFF